METNTTQQNLQNITTGFSGTMTTLGTTVKTLGGETGSIYGASFNVLNGVITGVISFEGSAETRSDLEKIAVGALLETVLTGAIGVGLGLAIGITAAAASPVLIVGAAAVAIGIGLNDDAIYKFYTDNMQKPIFDWIIKNNYDLEIKYLVNDLWNAAQNWAPPRHDPLVLDMDGDGIETVGINAINDVVFDADGDGLKTGTGWVKADDALLVYDRNGNGTIDDGSEFFGDQTMVDGVRATNGFAALAGEDTNSDGVFDASDTNYTNVRIWQDKNQDGISQSDELRTLTEAGIASISLTSTTTNKTTNGNTQIANKLNFNNTRRVG